MYLVELEVYDRMLLFGVDSHHNVGLVFSHMSLLDVQVMDLPLHSINNQRLGHRKPLCGGILLLQAVCVFRALYLHPYGFLQAPGYNR
ncbi:hypothetical protein D3C76_1145590 [compost metagenome]